MKLLSIPTILLLCTACGIFRGIGGGNEDELGFIPPMEAPFDCDDLDNQDDWDFIDLEYTGEEFAFDAKGNVVTASDWSSAIVAQSRDGDVEVIAPFQSDELAGVDLFPNGDILFADEQNGTIMKMTLSGVESLLAGGLPSPNSVIVHPGGTVFATAYDEIVEITPGTGDIDSILSHNEHDLDGLTLSLGYEYLWYNLDDQGLVYRIRTDGTDNEELMAELSPGRGELDGMATDVCGNVYALHTDGQVTRIQPDGRTETFVHVMRNGGDMFTSAIHFGSGLGGWEEDYVYIMDRFGGLFEVYVGVPGVPEPHL